MPPADLQIILTVIVWGYPLALTVYLLLRRFTGDQIALIAVLNNFTPYYFLPLIVLIPIAVYLNTLPAMALHIGLLFIGAFQFIPRYLPHAPTTDSTQPQLTVVTFNVSSTNRAHHLVEQWLRDTKPDIVLLQEVFSVESRIPPEKPE